MNWLETQPDFRVPLSVELDLAQRAADARPGDPAVRLRLADVLFRNNHFGEAAALYATERARAPDSFTAWAAFAASCAETGALEDALALCRRAEAAGPDPALSSLRALVLDRLGRHDEARAARLESVRLDSRRKLELAELFAPLARDRDGGRLLAFCDELPDIHRGGALDRAHRAIAYSRLGRHDEACALMDPDRHVAVVAFTPPPEFASLAAFNAELAAHVLADPPLSSRRAGVEINYSHGLHRKAAYRALQDFVRREMDAYIDSFAARGLAAVMPPRPTAGALRGASTVLKGKGRNGQHIHARAYVASVYYVSVPSAARRGDERGSLELGCCDKYTRGHAAAWPTRMLKPEPGRLVLFPGHLYHDVVPTGADELRISLPGDLVATHDQAPA